MQCTSQRTVLWTRLECRRLAQPTYLGTYITAAGAKEAEFEAALKPPPHLWAPHSTVFPSHPKYAGHLLLNLIVFHVPLNRLIPLILLVLLMS